MALKLTADHNGQVGEAAGIAPFVVVPAEDLRQAPGRLGQRGVEDAGRRVPDDVPGDQRGGAVAQHVRQRPGRGLREGLVDLIRRDVTAQDGSEVGEGPVLNRDADCDAVEPAPQLGADLAGGPVRPGGGRPSSSGMTWLVVLAAPVVVGSMLTAALRGRRESLCGASMRFWSPV